MARRVAPPARAEAVSRPGRYDGAGRGFVHSNPFENSASGSGGVAADRAHGERVELGRRRRARADAAFDRDERDEEVRGEAELRGRHVDGRSRDRQVERRAIARPGIRPRRFGPTRRCSRRLRVQAPADPRAVAPDRDQAFAERAPRDFVQPRPGQLDALLQAERPRPGPDRRRRARGPSRPDRPGMPDAW